MKKIIYCLLFVPFFVFSDMVKFEDWTVNSEVDPITDAKKINIIIINKTKNKNETAGFVFNCKSVSLVSMNLKDFPKADDVGNLTKVILRVDKNVPIEMQWTKSIIGYEFSNFDEISNLLKNGEKLVVRAQYSITKDFFFSLAGFSNAYEELQKNCTTK